MIICKQKRFYGRNLISKIIRNQPDENNNAWFLKLSKQSQLDFILNRESDGEIDFNKLKIKTLIETNKILTTMGKVEKFFESKEMADLDKLLDNAAESINEFVKRQNPIKKDGDFFISSIEGADYEVKITVTKKNGN